MAFSDNLKSILSDFINLETIQAIQNFTETSENDQKSVDLIAKMFGFTGEFFLQNQEFYNKLTESFTKNIFSKIGSLPSLPAIKRFSKVMDYKEYGGALFLGVQKPVVKAHGSSDEKLFKFTIKQAEQFVRNKAVDHLTEIYESQANKEKMQEIKEFIAPMESK